MRGTQSTFHRSLNYLLYNLVISVGLVVEYRIRHFKFNLRVRAKVTKLIIQMRGISFRYRRRWFPLDTMASEIVFHLTWQRTCQEAIDCISESVLFDDRYS